MYDQLFDYRVYSYICKDSELKKIFDELAEIYNQIEKKLNEEKEMKIKAIHPDFAPIKEQIYKLKKLGIEVEDYDCWFNVDEYLWDFEPVHIFSLAKFNGYKLNIEELKEINEFVAILNIDIDPDLLPGAQSVLDQDYFKGCLKKAKKEHKKIEKSLKKSKKPLKLYNAGEPTAVQHVTDIEKIEIENKRLHKNELEQNKINFLINLSVEQRSEFHKTCHDIYNMKEICKTFSEEKEKILQEYKTEQDNIINVINNRLFIKCYYEIEEKLKIKLLKTLMSYSFIEDFEISEDDISKETKLVIDYFVKMNRYNFEEWYFVFANNFDLFCEEKEKTKKIDCRRTIWD